MKIVIREREREKGRKRVRTTGNAGYAGLLSIAWGQAAGAES